MVCLLSIGASGEELGLRWSYGEWVLVQEGECEMVTFLALVGGVTMMGLSIIGLIVVVAGLDLVETKSRRRW